MSDRPIRLDRHNARRHPARNRAIIRQSLTDVGPFRSIGLDGDNVVRVGNGVYSEAQALGLRVRIVDAAPDELIAVRRADLHGAAAERAALYDNRASDTSEWEEAELAAIAADPTRADWLAALFRSDAEAAALDAALRTEPPLGGVFAASDAAVGPALNPRPAPDADDGAPRERPAPAPRPPDAPPAIERSDVPDTLWPTDNDWDIPLLDVTLQADAVDMPLVKWGTIARTTYMAKGTYHFYTQDYKFMALWRDPSPVVNAGVPTVVEPNVSINPQMPRAVALWRVYQKRWLARYWQARGLRVLVDCNVAPRHQDLNRLGIPPGWRAFATRGDEDALDQVVADWTWACTVAGTDRLLFLCYGGGQGTRALAHQHGWLWLPEDSDARRGRYAEALDGA